MAVARRQEEPTGDDQDWIFSYADMMSLLLCFFIMLFAMSVIDPNKAREISEKIRTAFKGIDAVAVPEVQVFDRPTERQARAFQLLVKMLEIKDSPERVVGIIEDVYSKRSTISDLEKIIDPNAKEDVLQEMDSPRGALTLIYSTETMFEPASSELSGRGKTQINAIAHDIRKVINDISIEVVGHTDGTPLTQSKKYADNRHLSTERARSVAKQLERLGIPAEQLKVSGMGEFQPLMREDRLSGSQLKEARQRNRRVEIRLSRRKT